MTIPKSGTGATGRHPSLRARVAAQTVMTQFLHAQTRTGRRSRLARAFGAGVLNEESQPWYRDALGELAVGEALSRLGEEWIVLHAVPLTAFDEDIDHIVIGPGGIFTLTTTNYSDHSVWAVKKASGTGGARRHHVRTNVRNAEFDMGRVERALSTALETTVHATGVIVVVPATTIPMPEMPRDVVVVSLNELVDWLHARPAVLSCEMATRLAALAEEPPGWVSSAVLEQNGERLRAEFGAIQREVASARVIQRVWLGTLISVLVGLAGLAAWGLSLGSTVPVG